MSDTEQLVIDLSHHNTITDMVLVAQAGVRGIIHKCSEGNFFLDPMYYERRHLARAANLLWGAYHFIRPGDMVAQAHYFVGGSTPSKDTLLAVDYEDAKVSLYDLKLFITTVRDLTGRMPVLYSGDTLKTAMHAVVVDPELASYRLWLAQYTTGQATWPNTWYNWWLWQYSDAGALPGITGSVDVNRYRGTLATLTAEWPGTIAGRAIVTQAPIPPAAPVVATGRPRVSVAITTPVGVDVVVTVNGAPVPAIST